MRTRLRFIFLAVCTSIVVIYIACCTHRVSEKSTKTSMKAGALDFILVSEHSDEAGPLVYSHYKHYGPKGEGMNGIACDVCHFCSGDARKDPIQSCRRCHFPHDESERRKEPSL